MFYFIRLIRPYIHESMKRKIAIPSDVKKVIKKRTTVYLPNTLHITQPTKNIYAILEKIPTLHNKLLDEHTYKNYLYKNFLC